ncbi:MAG: sugar ABC transporter substrate-binding protein [Clostridiales Family XIII bacterium]|jgi:ribose transport system substrate-binding protein|nr:sugar ABC transporter substrate-binding protein [Clostridiales Family XIII bacterium]
MKKKLFLIAALCIVMAATMSLAACSGGGQEEAPADDTATTEEPAATDTTDEPAATESNLDASKALMASLESVKGSDGQPLLIYGEAREVPEKPADPDALPEDDPLKYWNIEYAGRQTEKAEEIKSPADGCIGKKIIAIGQSEHPYWTAVFNGAKTAADALQMELTTWNPNGDLNQQNQLIDKAIAEKPDIIMLSPLDAKASAQQFKKIYDAGIPAIAYNMVPSDEAMRYVLALTAPDDFGQFKKLGEYVAEAVGGKAGVCYMTHLPGGSPYFARYSNVRAFYAENYPDMKYLDHQSPGFEAPKAKQVVADWITKYGDQLNVIVLSDDSAQAEGCAQAIREAGRDDIKVVAAGNSKVGMDLVKSGGLFAITYQSAEADGAIAVRAAAEYFNGETLEPCYYLPQAIITKDNVADYEPAQW